MPRPTAWIPVSLLVTALLTVGFADAAHGEASAPQAGLQIAGLSTMMTGWHRLEAVTNDPLIDHVGWRVNGRELKGSEGFATDIYFGQTPLPRRIEALAYGSGGGLEYTAKATVNAGGRALWLDFLAPLAGTRAVGDTEVRVCAFSPQDHPIERIGLRLAPVNGAADTEVEMAMTGRGQCRQGIEYHAGLTLSGAPAILTAKLFTRRRDNSGWAEAENGPFLEEGIFINTPPAIHDSIDVRLLEWPVSVARKGEPVRGLDASHFELYEDRARCDIRRVLTPQVVAFRLGLIFDWSGSTALDTDAEATAVSAFVDRLFDPWKDSAVVWAIAHSPIPYLGWTSDRAEIDEALARFRNGGRLSGGTALYDTLVRALYQFQSGEAQGIPAIILVTDGIDTSSADFDRQQALDYARESGVRIYPIGVRVRMASGRTTTIDEEFLGALASASGGTLHTLEVHESTTELRRSAEKLAAEAESLRRQPGELAGDPRFLDYLIAGKEEQAAALEALAATLDRRNVTPLNKIRQAFDQIRLELSSGYVLVAQSRAEQSDRWHSVEVRLTGVPGGRDYRIRAAAGIYW